MVIARCAGLSIPKVFRAKTVGCTIKIGQNGKTEILVEIKFKRIDTKCAGRQDWVAHSSTTMTKPTSHNNPSVLNEEFLEEYSTEDSLRKYSKETAGNGISYLLDHDYGEIYFGVIENQIPKSRVQKGIRLWEFGCGAGMNLIHLVSALERRGIPVDYAVGTDFSEALIGVANQEAKKYLTPEQNRKVRFCVASHENLVDDAAKRARRPSRGPSRIVRRHVGRQYGTLLSSIDEGERGRCNHRQPSCRQRGVHRHRHE